MIKRFFASVAGKVVGALIVAALGIGGTTAVVQANDDEGSSEVREDQEEGDG